MLYSTLLDFFCCSPSSSVLAVWQTEKRKNKNKTKRIMKLPSYDMSSPVAVWRLIHFAQRSDELNNQMDRWMDGGWMAALATTITTQFRRTSPPTSNSEQPRNVTFWKRQVVISPSAAAARQAGHQPTRTLSRIHRTHTHSQKARLQLGHITIQTSSAHFMPADEMCLSVVFHSLGWTHFARYPRYEVENEARMPNVKRGK